MKPTAITTIAALVLIGVGGFIAGRITSADHSESTPEPSAEMRGRRTMGNDSNETSKSASERNARRTTRPEQEGSPSSPEQLARLASIVRTEDPLDRARALLAFIDKLGPNDFEAAISQFRSLGITESRMGEYAQLLSAWAKVDPLAALAYAEKNTRSEFAASTILTTWAGTDPEAAIRWAETHHEGEGANPYLAGIIRSLAATDPTRASQLLTGMPKSVERGEALDAMLPHVISQGADATKAWIASLTDDSLRNGAMMRSAEQLAATDPSGTAAWLLANPGDATQRRMDDVYRVWAKNNQTEAVQSLSTLPAGENRTNALRGVVNSMATNNPQAAVSLMDRFQNDLNDRVVQNVIWHSFGSDPSLAVNQISRIADENERNRTYGRMLRAWTERDPVAANTWIQNNPLPQPVKDGLNRQ